MVIRFNFLHEIQTRKTQQQRDPLKLGMLGLLLIILLMAGYYMLRLNDVNQAKSSLEDVERQLKKAQPEAEEAVKQTEELKETIESVKLLKGYVEDRFFWAPVLQLVVNNTGPNVQLVNLNGVSSKDGDVIVTIGGVVVGQPPQVAADKYLETIESVFAELYPNADAKFNVLEAETDQSFKLNGEELPSARFSIRLNFQANLPSEQTPE